MRSTIKYAERCLRDEAQALLDIIPTLDVNFDKMVDLIYHCKGHVVCTGVGKSGHVAAKMAATLSSTGTPAFYLNTLDAFHGDLGMITTDDVVIMLSNSGNTDELLRIIPYMQERCIPVASMTGDSSSLLAKHSFVHLLVKVEREACPLNLAPTSSTTAAMAMGDAIAIALMQIRKFKANDFAMFHPGGYLGHKLLTQVKDVMYKDNLPIIPKDMLVVDAIIDISKGKLGLGVILENNKVQGIITDGDIRRAVEDAKDNLLNVKVEDVMTKNPKTIHPEAKLTQIQYMFRKFKIHSLLVVDDNRHLIGIVDYFAIMN